jgi:transcriptional regulator with PAS, ATPase and Fis domain
LTHKEGYGVPVIKKATTIVNDRKELIGIVETVTDLTDIYEARNRLEETTRRLGELHCLKGIIGKSPAMVKVFDAIRAAAKSDATVVIHGESGTGKELVASAIHTLSDRNEGPLITVNCSAFPESLLESELFGHARGAFTGALSDRKGRFESADGGTIFLDEVGDLTPYIQLKLLRVLQEHEVERLGESRKRPLDIRVMAATHRDLAGMVKEGSFREDFYYRLNVFQIRLPALWERQEDIPLLARHFMARLNEKTGKHIKDLSPLAMKAMMRYHWPGNIRELENAMEHAFVLCREKEIHVLDLPPEIRGKMRFPGCNRPGGSGESGKLTRDGLIAVLQATEWNKAKAARRLGLSRTAVWKRMKKWNIPLKPPTS